LRERRQIGGDHWRLLGTQQSGRSGVAREFGNASAERRHEQDIVIGRRVPPAEVQMIAALAAA
jgi:hypothetical protein